MTANYKTIVIDDEPLARKRLLKLLGNFPETFQIVATAKNGSEAKQKIMELKPDVVFLDIEMPGLNGFQVLDGLETLPIVIFCTAYDQYALKAFEMSSIDYLVKPVRLDRLEKTIEKLKLFDANLSSKNILNVIKEVSQLQETKLMTSITVKKRDRLIFVKLDAVSHFRASEKYVTVFTKNETHLAEQSLIQLEQKLPTNFLRVHRGIIINTNYVKEVQKYFNSRFIITLNNIEKTKITTSRSYNEQIKNWMDV